MFEGCPSPRLLSNIHLAAMVAAFANPVLSRPVFAQVPADSPLRNAPRVADVPTDRLPRAQLIGTPEVRTLLGYTRRALHLHDGHTIALFSFSGSAPANWLFLMDTRDLSTQRYDIPNNDVASHGAALGSDGNIYVMPYGTAHAYRFDVKRKTFEELETTLPKGEYTWDAFGASNGCIYFGTYPNAYLGEYNIAAKTWTLFKQVAPDTKYTRGFSEDADGRVRFKATGPDLVWLTFDPEARKIERADAPTPAAKAASAKPLPAPPAGDLRLRRSITIADRRFAVSFPTSRFWEITDQGKPILRGRPQAPAEVWFLEPAENAVIGVSHFGAAFRYDLTTGAFFQKQLPNRAPGGNGIMLLEAVTPRCVIGANYSQQNLFRIDPETSRIDHCEHMIARVTGEPMCAVGFAGKAYLGIYINSILSVYDPDRPFEFGINPRELIELGPRYAQTRPRDAVTNGRLVFISSDSAYNHLGGALAVIDPNTGKIDVYHHLIRDQNLPTLAYDPVTRLIWGGTDRWGQMRSHPPTQKNALIYAFDPRTRKVVTTLTPWPDADVVAVLGVSTDGTLVATSNDQIALITTTTREILYNGPFPIGIPRRIRRGHDRRSYCLTGGKLYRWDLAQNVLTPLAATPGPFFTEPAPGTWLTADATSVYRLRLPQKPPK